MRSRREVRHFNGLYGATILMDPRGVQLASNRLASPKVTSKALPSLREDSSGSRCRSSRRKLIEFIFQSLEHIKPGKLDVRLSCSCLSPKKLNFPRLLQFSTMTTKSEMKWNRMLQLWIWFLSYFPLFLFNSNLQRLDPLETPFAYIRLPRVLSNVSEIATRIEFYIRILWEKNQLNPLKLICARSNTLWMVVFDRIGQSCFIELVRNRSNSRPSNSHREGERERERSVAQYSSDLPSTM